MQPIFFDSWSVLYRTAILGSCAYAVLVVALRLYGPRTLAKMNAFDFIVSVALGSSLASTLTSKDVTLAQGVLVLLLLMSFQFVVAWLSVRVPWFESLVKSEPVLLVRRGTFLPGAMKRHRVSKEEIRSAARSSGFAGLGDVEAVVLETDGTFAVIPRSSEHATDPSTLDPLRTDD